MPPKSFGRLRATCLFLTLGLTLWTHPAAANPLEPVAGPHSMAMGGAHRGLGTSNDTLLLNPAGMAALRRYSVEALYHLRGDHISRLVLSAVDSRTGPIAAGVIYTREWGNPSGYAMALNRTTVGFATSPLEFVSVGITATNVKGGFAEDDVRHEVNNFNGSAGVMVHLAQLVSLGVSYDNFVHKDAQGLLPPALAFGGAIRTRYLGLAGDMRLDRRSAVKNSRTYYAGTELFLGQLFTLRGGWRLGYPSPSITTELKQYVSGGLGCFAAGSGVEASFEKALAERSWSFAVGMQFAM